MCPQLALTLARFVSPDGAVFWACAFRSKERGGGVLQYADGRALQEHPSLGLVKREFTTDEDGRFSVGGLPVGIVYVGFPHFEGGDESSDDWVAQVCEDQTTEVRLFDPVGSRPLPVEFHVGDGSNTQYESGTGLMPNVRWKSAGHGIPRSAWN